jgi:hypothetical protein
LKSGKAVEDFSLHLSGIVSELQALREDMTELKALHKYIRMVPTKYAQMVCSAETLLNLSDMSGEELSGRLAVSAGYGKPEIEEGSQTPYSGGGKGSVARARYSTSFRLRISVMGSARYSFLRSLVPVQLVCSLCCLLFETVSIFT